MSELGQCTIAEATFPVPEGTRPVDRPPYRPNPRTSAVIDKCVNEIVDLDLYYSTRSTATTWKGLVTGRPVRSVGGR